VNWSPRYHRRISEQPLTTLRGASVAVDPRRVGRIAVALVIVALAVLTVGLFVAGAHKNAQVNGLKQHGITVVDTVAKCIGLLGGSGSNGVGFECWGTFSIDGHSHYGPIPGNSSYAVGTKVRLVADPDDPGVVSTAKLVSTETASVGVYLVPAILLVVLLLLVGATGIAYRRSLSRPSSGSSA